MKAMPYTSYICRQISRFSLKFLDFYESFLVHDAEPYRQMCTIREGLQWVMASAHMNYVTRVCGILNIRPLKNQAVLVGALEDRDMQREHMAYFFDLWYN